MKVVLLLPTYILAGSFSAVNIDIINAPWGEV